MDHHHNNHHHQQQHQPRHQLHHHQQNPHHHHPQHHMMYTNNPTTYAPPHMIPMPNYTHNHTRFPFNSPIVPNQSPPPQPQPQIQDIDPYSGSGGGEFDPNSVKKKRGRPRKYSPDEISNSGGGGGGGGIVALGLGTTPISPSGDGGGGVVAVTEANSLKKNRGRPPSSSKKQLDALGNCGVGFTPHVILVNAGEDIASKIMEFSKEGERTICVLSANGSISNADLRQPAMTGNVVKYEGLFEIISLSGSFLFSENNGGQGRAGGLTVSLANSDGGVLGGGVVGVLRAASNVQIIVGSFIANGKKPKYMPSVPQSNMPTFSAPPLPGGESSPPSQEISTDGSDENGRSTETYGNSNHPMQHHNMQQMYSHMNWSNPGSKMVQN